MKALASSLYMEEIQTLTSAISEADLREKIDRAVEKRYQREREIAWTKEARREREKAAFDAMNKVEPHYLEADEADWKRWYGLD